MPVTTSIAMPVYHLRILGGFGLHFQGEPVPVRAGGARLLALLAMTAGARHRLDRSTVGRRLWIHDPDRAGARLRTALSRLPAVDGYPIVEPTSGTVRLAERVSVDYWQAESQAHALAHPCGEPVEVDLSHFIDDVLPDWDDDWLLTDREAFRQTRLHALERASEQLRMQGRFEDSLRAAFAAVSCEPLRETAHRCVVRAHLAEGNPAEALRQYHRYRRLLASELGLAPTPAMRTLVEPLLVRPGDHRSRRRPGEPAGPHTEGLV